MDQNLSRSLAFSISTALKTPNIRDSSLRHPVCQPICLTQIVPSFFDRVNIESDPTCRNPKHGSAKKRNPPGMTTSPSLAPLTSIHNLKVEVEDPLPGSSMQNPPSISCILSNPPLSRAYGAICILPGGVDDDVATDFLSSTQASAVAAAASFTSPNETSIVHSTLLPEAPQRGSIHVPASRPTSKYSLKVFGIDGNVKSGDTAGVTMRASLGLLSPSSSAKLARISFAFVSNLSASSAADEIWPSSLVARRCPARPGRRRDPGHRGPPAPSSRRAMNWNGCANGQRRRRTWKTAFIQSVRVYDRLPQRRSNDAQQEQALAARAFLPSRGT